MSRPAWVEEIATGAGRVATQDLTAFEPPEGSTPRRSAVLMLFGESDQGPDVLLTERSRTLSYHPGQIAFPGGGVEGQETAAEAALREAHEEAGVESGGVEVVAQLPQLWLPPSDNLVTPVIGWWHTPGPLVAEAEEVGAIYRVPISELRDPAYRVRVTSPRTGWVLPGFLVGPEHDAILWGFTGGIVYRFLMHLGWLTDVPDAPVVSLPEVMLSGRERSELER